MTLKRNIHYIYVGSNKPIKLHISLRSTLSQIEFFSQSQGDLIPGHHSSLFVNVYTYSSFRFLFLCGGKFTLHSV